MESNRSSKANDTDFVTVYTSNGPLGAEVIKSKLESAGIPSFLKYESAGRVMGFTLDGLGEVQVMVSRARELEARELLAGPAD